MVSGGGGGGRGSTEGGLIVSQHIHYIPRSSFAAAGVVPTPTYLNMVRHPINRVQSDYYYLIDPSSRPKGRAEEEIARRQASRCGCHGLTFSQCVLSVRLECTENLSLGDDLLQYFCGDEVRARRREGARGLPGRARTRACGGGSALHACA